MDLITQISMYLDHELMYRRPGGVDAYKRVLGRFARFAGERTLDERLVFDFIVSRRGKAMATIAAEITVLSSFSAWLKHWGESDTDLMRLVKRPSVQRGDVLEAPRSTILQVVAWLKDDRGEPRSQRFVALCLYAGLRFTEARLIDWSAVDLLTGDLVVKAATAKFGKARRIPIGPELDRLLLLVPEPERIGAVAGLPDGQNLTRGGAEHIFGRELLREGIDVTAHQLRRAFATRLDEQGVSLRVIQTLLGHSSLATTERYIGVDRARKVAAVQALRFDD